MDGHFSKEEFIGAIDEFVKTHGPSLARYDAEKSAMLDETKDLLS